MRRPCSVGMRAKYCVKTMNSIPPPPPPDFLAVTGHCHWQVLVDTHSKIDFIPGSFLSKFLVTSTEMGGGG